MTVIREGNLEFSFGDKWTVIKYDENGAFYRTLMAQNVDKTKAVDFLCHCPDEPLLMLEVKDFSVAVPEREKFDTTPMDIAKKIRDTLAGIIGGCHCASQNAERAFFGKAYQCLSKAPFVAFYFEDLATPARRPPQRESNKRDVFLKELKKCLRWLTRKIAIIGKNDYKSFIDDLKIRKVDS